MAQGLFAGATKYSEQTKQAIGEDIVCWIAASKKIKPMFIETILLLKNHDYWNNIPYNFQMFCENLPNVIKTIISDLELVHHNIEKDHIAQADINLLKNIFNIVTENEEFCWRSYKDASDGYWYEYGNKDFALVETLYKEGRDYLITLKDISNAAERLKDYMKEEKNVHIEQNNCVNMGDHNRIKSINLENGSKNSKEKNKKKESKFIWFIVIPIATAVIAGILLLLIEPFFH